MLAKSSIATLALVTVAAISLSSTASAAFVLTAPTGESGADFTGTFTAAINYSNAAGDKTVGDAVFTTVTIPSPWGTWSDNNSWGLADGTADFKDVINGFAYTYDPISVTTNFTVVSGSTYKLQVFIARGNVLDQSFTLSGANTDSYAMTAQPGTDGSFYYLLTDTFVANSTSLTLTTLNSNNCALNGITLEAVPEPATSALLAFSLTTVMVLRRRPRNA